MHELAIAQSVVEIASRHAAGRSVNKVGLKVGALRQVVPSSLAFNFELVALGTPLEGAELEIEPIEARGRCRACRAESVLVSFPLICRTCGSFELDIVEGDELDVEWLELEEAESGAYCT